MQVFIAQEPSCMKNQRNKEYCIFMNCCDWKTEEYDVIVINWGGLQRTTEQGLFVQILDLSMQHCFLLGMR